MADDRNETDVPVVAEVKQSETAHDSNKRKFFDDVGPEGPGSYYEPSRDDDAPAYGHSTKPDDENDAHQGAGKVEHAVPAAALKEATYEESVAAQYQHQYAPPGTVDDNSAEAYNNVPPPSSLSEFEIAKKKAAELAAKFSQDGEAKRIKKDYSSSENTSSAPGIEAPHGQYGNPQPSHDYGSHGSQQFSKRIELPQSRVGLVIGKGGETIRYLQQSSGAKIQIVRDADADLSATTRPMDISGTSEQVAMAEKLLKEVLSQDNRGGGGGGGGFGQDPGAGSVTMRVPNSKVGLIIGRGGETIKALQAKAGARVQIQSDKEMEPGSSERILTLSGPKSSIDMAAQFVAEVIDENRPRGPPSFMQGAQTAAPYRPAATGWGSPSQTAQAQSGYQAASYQQPAAAAYASQQQSYAPQQYPGGYPAQAQASYQAQATGGYQAQAAYPGGYYAAQQTAPGAQAAVAPPGQEAYYAQSAQGGYYGYQGYPQQQAYAQQQYAGYYQQPAQATQQQQPPQGGAGDQSSAQGKN